MRNNEFWDRVDGQLRRSIRSFIENHELTCGWSDVQQNEYESALTELIESIKEDVYREVEREYYREDIFLHANNDNGERCQGIAMLLPVDKLDSIVKSWDENLSNNDGYWDYYWGAVTLALQEETWWRDYEDYTEDEFSWYKAYIEHWYSTHQEGMPVCIEEFLNNEMQDEELALFYKELSRKEKI